MTDRIRYIIAPPYHDELNDFSWVSDYLKSETITKELVTLRAEKKRIRSLPPDVSSLKEKIERSHAALIERQLEMITIFLRRVQHSKDPLVMVERSFIAEPALTRAFAPVPLDLLLEAVDHLEEPGAISEADREKLLSGIDKQIQSAEKRLADASPEKYFTFRNGVVEHDKRKQFISQWTRTQSTCREAVGPQGVELRFSSPAEKKAHKALGIHKAIAAKGYGDLAALEPQFVVG